MPEGHVIHRLANAIGSAFADTQVEVTSPQGRFAESAAMHGRRLGEPSLRGGHLDLCVGEGRANGIGETMDDVAFRHGCPLGWLVMADRWSWRRGSRISTTIWGRMVS